VSFLVVFLAVQACSAKQPNVVVIMTDDQGYRELSVPGNPITQTLSIDRLAREGISLTDLHVAPMCRLTRGQFLTGLDEFRNGAINVSSGRTLLRPELRTNADVFKAVAIGRELWEVASGGQLSVSARGLWI